MPAIMLKLKCITNMHVGSGDVNYNIIDNEIERDPITKYPVINASGVKGALREYFNKNSQSIVDINDIFGSDSQEQNTPGKLKFLEANMLTIPARASSGDNAYYMVSTKEALDRYVEFCKILFDKNIKYAEESEQGKSAEGIVLNKSIILLDEKIYILGEREFKKIPLPIIARNKLDNGISKNLWYEEIVPHQTVFYFSVIANDKEQDLLRKFRNTVNNQVIQFGANASIGYGLCKVNVVEE